MISFRSSLVHFSARAVTLLEALTVIVIMGIAIFVTLPHLTNSKADADKAAIKAKAAQLNIAKDSYISLVGVDQAQINWTNAASDQARFVLLHKPNPGNPSQAVHLLAPAPADTVVNLNGLDSTTCFAVPGYVFVFPPAPPAATEKIIGQPVLIYQDVNLNGIYDDGIDTPLPY